jgi:predicted peptidase
MHKPIFTLLVSGSLALLCACTTVRKSDSASGAPGQQTLQHFQQQLSRSVDLDYLLYLPQDYTSTGAKKWPLMLFLHGAGERGADPQKVTVHGPPKIVKTLKDFPFVLVSPQCPEESIWHDDELLALLDRVIATHNIDTNRVYLTGLSMGGYGTWSLGSRFPERFAAMAPICGGGELLPLLLASPPKKQALSSLGVWAFHGGKDSVVPISESQRMTNAFIRAGCKDVKLTIYPEAGHDSWTQAYNEPSLWNWFLAHHRAGGGASE